MNKSRNSTGFTLIEMLVATAMIATIVSMVYGSYAATSQSVARYDGLLKCSGRAHLVLRLMARQLRGAYAPAADANAPAHASDGSPANTQPDPARPSNVQLVTRVPVFHGDARDPRGQILSFVTTAGFGTGLNGPRALAVMSYRYDAPTSTLAINCQPYMGQSAGPSPSATWQPVLRNVTAFDIEFHDGRQWRQKWRADRNGLPRAVRLRLVALDERDRPYHFGTTVPLLSHAASLREVPGRPTERSKL